MRIETRTHSTRNCKHGISPYQISENVAAPITIDAGDNVLTIPISEGNNDAMVLDFSRRVMQSLIKGDTSRRKVRDKQIIREMKAIQSR